ncbi:MAG: hypothetical protein KDD50_01830 [Bdellovibrionales bacterium]|nr:hypothetical protein [Bdellovibrionales bacterium]
MKIAFFFGIIFFSLILRAEEACESNQTGLCPLGRIDFKTKTFKHLGNKALNAIEPLVVEGLNSPEVKLHIPVNTNPNCSDPSFVKGLSDKQKEKKLEKENCTLVPLFLNGEYKSKTGGEDLSFTYKDMKVEKYSSKFVDIECNNDADSKKRKCKMKATIDLHLRGSFHANYAGEDMKYQDYKMQLDSVEINFDAIYDTEKNQFKIIKNKPGANAFDLSKANVNLFYDPDDKKRDELVIDLGNRLYDRLKDEYFNGLKLRKSRSTKLEFAKKSYEIARQNQKAIHERWKSRREVLFGDLTHKEIEQRFKSNREKIDFICSNPDLGMQWSCNEISQARDLKRNKSGFHQYLVSKKIEDFVKLSPSEKLKLGCGYLKQENPSACQSFTRYICVVSGKSRRYAKAQRFYVDSREQCNPKEFSTSTNSSQIKTTVIEDYSDGVPLSPLITTYKNITRIFGGKNSLTEGESILEQAQKWLGSKPLDVTSIEMDLVRDFDLHSYDPISSKSQRNNQEIPDEARVAVEYLSDKKRDELFGHDFYLAQKQDGSDKYGYEVAYNHFKRDMDKIFGPGFFNQERSKFEKAKTISEKIDELILSTHTSSGVTMMVVEERAKTLVNQGACSSLTFCYATELGSQFISKTLNDSDHLKEVLGEKLTDSLINEMIEQYNDKYSQYSPFGSGNSYETPIPCVQCLVDYPILSRETKAFLEKHPNLKRGFEEIQIPDIPSDKEFNDWLDMISGKGINDNPCLGNQDKSKAVKKFKGYFGIGPRLLMDEAKDKMMRLKEDLQYYAKHRKNTKFEQQKIERNLEKLEQRMAAIEKQRQYSLIRQNSLKTQIALMSTLDIAEGLNVNSEKISRINLFSNLSCNENTKCVEEEMSSSRKKNKKSDGSIFLNIGAVNAYIKKLNDLGVLDVCSNENGRTCASSLASQNKCLEPKSKSGKNPIHIVRSTKEPQVQLDPNKKLIRLHGEINYNNVSPLVSLLDDNIDIYTQAKFVRCPANASNQCIQNVETVAKIWNLLGKNIDGEMEELLRQAGVSDQTKEAALNQGIGFDGMSLTDIVVHKCSIEIQVNFKK